MWICGCAFDLWADSHPGYTSAGRQAGAIRWHPTRPNPQIAVVIQRVTQSCPTKRSSATQSKRDRTNNEAGRFAASVGR